MGENARAVVGTCHCGGYGVLTGDCHEELPEVKPSLEAIQEAVLILPCQEGRTVGSGVEFDSTIQHAPTCPAHYITAVARRLTVHRDFGKAMSDEYLREVLDRERRDDLHRGWRIENICPPVPQRSHNWAATPPDYDGEGIVLYGETREDVVAEIDQWLSEQEEETPGE